MVLFTACQEDDFGSKSTLQEGESLFTFSLPEPVVASRADLGEAGSQPIENLHILVFNEQGFFLANATATMLEQNSMNGKCTANLPVSNRKCRLHFVANYTAYKTYSSIDTESSVIGSMVTGNNQDAYWGMVEVDNIPVNGLTLDKPVELIRNFAKISLKSVAEGLEVISYTVYNKASEGLVAPFNPQKGTFADFINVSDANPYEDFKQKNPGEYYFFTRYSHQCFTDQDFSDTSKEHYLFFGHEHDGIPKEILTENLDRCLRIPMSDKVRSLNLSNCAAICIYEALRQQNYPQLSKVEVQKGEEFLYEL